ncbi:unnamed protein product [Hermetia illucens]|uniref:Uncharacterized protein n=1 Tax=Hermetia illucens TaxID=343691 RepID=A0A7R8Z1P9_HERIL|nr:unnamed protein product [Hermetia illucens]
MGRFIIQYSFFSETWQFIRRKLTLSKRRVEICIETTETCETNQTVSITKETTAKKSEPPTVEETSSMPRVVGVVLKKSGSTSSETSSEIQEYPKLINTDSFTPEDLELFVDSIETIQHSKADKDIAKQKRQTIGKPRRRPHSFHEGKKTGVSQDKVANLNCSMRRFIDATLRKSKACKLKGSCQKDDFFKYVVESMILYK